MLTSRPRPLTQGGPLLCGPHHEGQEKSQYSEPQPPSVRQLTRPGNGLSGNLATAPRNLFHIHRLTPLLALNQENLQSPAQAGLSHLTAYKERDMTGSPDSGLFF